MSRFETLYRRKVRAYQWLYEFTYGQCGECANSGCACKDSICAHVEGQARCRGIKLKTGSHSLRFIGEGGCLVPPHLRETCTIYLCEKAQNKSGFDRRRYERLKNLCAKLDWTLMCLEVQESSTNLQKTGARIS